MRNTQKEGNMSNAFGVKWSPNRTSKKCFTLT